VGFIACKSDTQEYGELAALLLQMTDEMGFHVWSVRTVPGGFEAHDDVIAVLNGEKVLTMDPAEAAAIANEGKTPPPSWSEPLETPDIEFVDGKYVLTEDATDRIKAEDSLQAASSPASEYLENVGNAAGREEIRAWAKENGFEVAPQGKLKQAVIEAFRVAHPDRATAE